jgi:hypothetical protein
MASSRKEVSMQRNGKLRSLIRMAGMLLFATAALLSFSRPAFAQGDRGTITGTVVDSASLAVPSAAIVATSVERGEVYNAASTSTGNFTIPALPVGHYNLTVTAQGFNQYIQNGITIQVAQTARVDVVLTVGAVTQSVTVTADAELLKTEGADQSQTVSGDQINRLPLTIGGNGLYGTRSPLASLDLVPGVQNYVGTNFVFRANGASNSPRYLVDGQDIDLLGMVSSHLSESHPSTEAIQEVTILTSNFAAEYGQVQGGMVSFTTRSGTNRYHGGGYDYLQNEHFNAGRPFTSDGNGHLVRPKQRNNNYGFTIGGPVRIPKVYNGKNKTFFFFTLDQFRQTQNVTGAALTVPTLAMRNGDFSKILTGKTLGTDPLGNPILENAIYDPTTDQTLANGQVVRRMFSGNIIPLSEINGIAKKIQGLIPNPDSGNLSNINNLTLVDSTFVLTTLPSFKIDQAFGDKTKLAFTFNSWINWTSKSAGDGLPFPISNARQFVTHTPQIHLNIDRTITPSLLVHLGGGEVRYWHTDAAPPASRTYDAIGQLGLIGGLTDVNPMGTTGFPAVSGIGSATVGGQPTNIGWSSATLPHTADHPSFTSSATWIKGNHSYKFGAEWWRDMNGSRSGATGGSWSFSGAETGQPYLNSTSLAGGAVGFGYASFLLGNADSASIRNQSQTYTSKHAVGFYAQDTWKVTHKLTLDYGIRYDYQTAPHEMDGRSTSFSPTLANPSAGGLPGATIYEGYGPGRCNCSFSNVYPFAIGPRLGVAYQIDQKTVLRAGYGMVYGRTGATNQNSSTYGVGFNTLNFTSVAFGQSPVNFSQGLHYSEAALGAATLGAGIQPTPGTLTAPASWWDDTTGRPPRINQWSISLQREIFKDLVVEAAYVGNRASHIASGNVVQLNALTPQMLAAKGFDITNSTDRSVLLGTLATALANPATVAKYGLKLPYAGYPTSATVAQSLRPYPQFSSLGTSGSQRGYSWYDALQSKVTKRYSHGLTASVSFTWQRELEYGIGVVNNVYNQRVNKQISSFSQPLVLAIGLSYTSSPMTKNGFVRRVTRDWTIGSFLHYASGFPILVPIAQNNLNLLLFGNSSATQSGTTSASSASGTFANRVAGQPLFIKSLNCHCIDPNKDFVLNPAAWTDPAAGTFGTSAAYYNDYRFQRHPGEQIGIGRLFPLHREGMSVEVRFEFFNMFNRAQMADPTFSNALATQNRNGAGVPTSGFGYINSQSPGDASIIDNQTGLGGNPREGQLLVRFKF